MIEVTTLIKQETGFVDIGSDCVFIEDPEYIEGAIVLRIDGIELLTTEMWDYVDQLWCYLVEGIEAVEKGSSFQTYFPDQPILLTFAPESISRLRLTVDFNESVVVERVEFTRVMLAEAIRVFERLSSLLPADRLAYESPLQTARATLSRIQ